MYIFLIFIHVIMCLVLIFVVLLQAGRGGGFSEMLGGGQPQSLFGTQTNQFMTRATEVCAVVFIITSLTLGIMSTQRGKSLLDKRRLGQGLKTMMPKIPQLPSNATPPAPGAIPVLPKAEAPGAPPQAAPAAAAPVVNASAANPDSKAPQAAEPAKAKVA